MEEIALVQIDVREFKDKIYAYYLEIFPEEERKSIQKIEISYQKGYTQILKIAKQDTLVGFMLLNRVKKDACAILDYFAILPQFRQNGLGTKALQHLLKQEKNGIFIEIEKPGLGKNEKENQIREKRQQFYEKLGFKKLDFDLFLFDVIYLPYLFPAAKKDEKVMLEEVFRDL